MFFRLEVSCMRMQARCGIPWNVPAIENVEQFIVAQWKSQWLRAERTNRKYRNSDKHQSSQMWLAQARSGEDISHDYSSTELRHSVRVTAWWVDEVCESLFVDFAHWSLYRTLFPDNLYAIIRYRHHYSSLFVFIPPYSSQAAKCCVPNLLPTNRVLYEHWRTTL